MDEPWQKLDGTPVETGEPIDWTTNPFLEMKPQTEMTPRTFRHALSAGLVLCAKKRA